MTKNITKVNTAEIQSIQTEQSVETFITKAIEQKAPIETLERLFTLQEKVNAMRAKTAFDQAMAKFQADCPVVKKTKWVKDSKGKDRYSYAPLDEIVTQVKKPLADNGLSYKFDEVKDEKNVTITCIAKHIMGHFETSSFQIPIGTEAYMTDVQKHGARMTFAKRYSFCNVFGILTGDEDTDANEPQEVKKPENELMLDDASIKQIQSAKTLETLNALCKSIQDAKGTRFRKSIIAHYMARKNEIESSQIADEVAAGLAGKEQV